ncbi:uncharacterized protein LOC122248413 [Penaeus japonicus]|uniref:uncharacterized protein LOC122248413 n=1 Tax=Penaeus japonicus TaxID=27405 RepID=UPI001C70E058|nr:uncharacterized protein LOC122248413 [Penaeus japonicus]
MAVHSALPLLLASFVVAFVASAAVGIPGEDCHLPRCRYAEGYEVWCSNPGSEDEYIAHPTDSRHFFQCSVMGPTEKTCPLGTVWDQSLLTCVEGEPVCGL